MTPPLDTCDLKTMLIKKDLMVLYKTRYVLHDPLIPVQDACIGTLEYCSLFNECVLL